ncbi:hypothetical protein SteCoe_28091 [Stentor coeruleus]|uniref:ISXO2-like transposase domain-containing protein n=1 Tax=Stentor coeruleus TaxID=5963 RepID=A0A1R2B9H7_9CILI|nr:hypothetical protein SteCoe_28091 [Stentor coeruleus]
MFLTIVPDLSSAALLKIIEEHATDGSIIVANCWKGYNPLSKLGLYFHETVNHSECFKNPDSGFHTNHIEGTWSGIKIGLSSRQRIKEVITENLVMLIWRRKNVGTLWKFFFDAIPGGYITSIDSEMLIINFGISF